MIGSEDYSWRKFPYYHHQHWRYWSLTNQAPGVDYPFPGEKSISWPGRRYYCLWRHAGSSRQVGVIEYRADQRMELEQYNQKYIINYQIHILHPPSPLKTSRISAAYQLFLEVWELHTPVFSSHSLIINYVVRPGNENRRWIRVMSKNNAMNVMGIDF